MHGGAASSLSVLGHNVALVPFALSQASDLQADERCRSTRWVFVRETEELRMARNACESMVLDTRAGRRAVPSRQLPAAPQCDVPPASQSTSGKQDQRLIARAATFVWVAQRARLGGCACTCSGDVSRTDRLQFCPGTGDILAETSCHRELVRARPSEPRQICQFIRQAQQRVAELTHLSILSFPLLLCFRRCACPGVQHNERAERRVEQQRTTRCARSRRSSNPIIDVNAARTCARLTSALTPLRLRCRLARSGRQLQEEPSKGAAPRPGGH